MRNLCDIRGVEVIEAHAMTDYVHMLVKIPLKQSMSGFMRFLIGRSAVLVNEQHGNLKYKYVNGNFWSKGYYASTVGLNLKTIQKYIREQEADDRVRDSIRDPFKK